MGCAARNATDTFTTMQTTFEDYRRQQLLRNLTDNDRAVYRLLDMGVHQSLIAKRIGRSRAYVCQVVKKGRDLGLLKRTTKDRQYNLEYELSDPLKKAIKKEETPENREKIADQFTYSTSHNIRLKYPIIRKTGISLDTRAGFFRKWKPRGPERYLFWMPGRQGYGDIMIDVTPKSLIAYFSAEQKIPARNPAERDQLIRLAIHEGVLKFISRQRAFGYTIDVETPEGLDHGRQITKTHYAFEMSRENPAVSPLIGKETPSGFWVDQSPADHGEADKLHVETLDIQQATQLEAGIHAAQQMPRILAELERKLSPIQGIETKIATIEATLTSGTPLENRVNQLIGLLAAALTKIDRLEDRVNGTTTV